MSRGWVLAGLLALAATPPASAEGGGAPAPEAEPPAGTPPGERRSPGEPDGFRPERVRREAPLAGRALETDLFGLPIELAPRDRSRTVAVTLGATFFSPPVGDNRGVPFAALYLHHHWVGRRMRAVLSGFVNEIDLAEQWQGPELLFRFENYTVPFPSRELVDGVSVEASSLLWGTVDGWLGLGWRWPLAPYNVDNELLVGVFYHGGLEYHRRTHDTPDGAVIPRDTYTHGLRVRLRADGLQRNLLEQPHLGWAAGLDLEYTRRDFWRDYGTPGLGNWDREETRDVVKASGYLVAALPVPWLSDRHRFVFQGHAGFAPIGKLDRFSAFRVGGGPLPTETNDLGRNPFPGAMFDQFPLEEYLILTAEYRVELLFFVFLHLRYTYAIGSTSTLRGGVATFRQDTGTTVTAALTTGFVWDSTLYFEFDYDVNGALRGGDQLGSTFVVMWSKAF